MARILAYQLLEVICLGINQVLNIEVQGLFVLISLEDFLIYNVVMRVRIIRASELYTHDLKLSHIINIRTPGVRGRRTDQLHGYCVEIYYKYTFIPNLFRTSLCMKTNPFPLITRICQGIRSFQYKFVGLLFCAISYKCREKFLARNSVSRTIKR